MPDDELFEWKEVEGEIPPEDMPGRPIKRVRCDKCREYIQDKREVYSRGKTLCRACAGKRYYKLK